MRKVSKKKSTTPNAFLSQNRIVENSKTLIFLGLSNEQFTDGIISSKLESMKLKSCLLYRDFFLHSNESNRNSMKIEVQLADAIDGVLFKDAVRKTMKRYPYYCVTLGYEEGEYFFAENDRPVVILNSLASPTFNTEETNMHFISFGYKDDWIVINMFHILTDGTGLYSVLRTLLYYYCGERYGVSEEPKNVRLLGQPVSEVEWYDPYQTLKPVPLNPKPMPGPAVNIRKGIPEEDRTSALFHLLVPEKEFMDFCVRHDSTPATMICLLLCRIIHRMFPDAQEAIRFLLCTNDRKFLNAEQSCFNMVGTIPLELKPEMYDWSLTRQATVFRGMVFAETFEKNALVRANETKMLCETIKAIEGEQQRAAFVQQAIGGIVHSICGMVSYVGKSAFPNADPYIRDVRSFAESAAGLGVQLAAFNGSFMLEMIQQFQDDRYIQALRKELEKYGIPTKLCGTFDVSISKANLPWLQDCRC